MDVYKVVKVVLIGAPGVGKTSLIKRLIAEPGEPFTDNQRSTIGVDFKTLKLTSRKTGNCIAFQIWDTAGQERFKAICKSHYRGAHIFLYVYDVTRKSTLDEVRNWIKETEWIYNEETSRFECAHTPCAKGFLVGNKCDTPLDRKEASYEEGESMAEAHGMVCFETSAKSGANVLTIFQSLADMMDEHLVDIQQDQVEEDGDVIHLGSPQVMEFLNKDKKSCC